MRRITKYVHQVTHYGVGVKVRCNNVALFLDSTEDMNKVTCKTCKGEAKGGRPKSTKSKPAHSIS